MNYNPQSSKLSIAESRFPGCCGIRVCHDAGGELGEMAKVMGLILDDERDDDDGDCDCDSEDCIADPVDADVGLVLYSLTDHQKVEKAALLENGFEELRTFKSPSTSNTITLYGKAINQPKPKPRRR